MSLAYGEDLARSFPEELNLILQNRKIFDEAHASSELGNVSFRLLHPGFAQALDGVDQKHFLLDGVATYEIAAGFDDPTHTESDPIVAQTATTKACIVVASHSPYELLVEGSESLEVSLSEAPQLISFGSEVLGRYASDRHQLSYGLVGIALARLYHLSITAEIERLKLVQLSQI